SMVKDRQHIAAIWGMHEFHNLSLDSDQSEPDFRSISPGETNSVVRGPRTQSPLRQMLERDVELLQIDGRGAAVRPFLYALRHAQRVPEPLDGRAAFLAGRLGSVKLAGFRHHDVARV